LIALVIGLAFITLATSNSADIIRTSTLHSHSKQIEHFLARTLAASVNQKAKLTLYISRHELQVFKNIQLLSKYKTPKGYSLKKQSTQNLDSWIEDIFSSGVQSPFTLVLTKNKDFCLITISLRGRVTTKCFYL
jgi:hypothetical protein